MKFFLTLTLFFLSFYDSLQNAVEVSNLVHTIMEKNSWENCRPLMKDLELEILKYFNEENKIPLPKPVVIGKTQTIPPQYISNLWRVISNFSALRKVMQIPTDLVFNFYVMLPEGERGTWLKSVPLPPSSFSTKLSNLSPADVTFYRHALYLKKSKKLWKFVRIPNELQMDLLIRFMWDFRKLKEHDVSWLSDVSLNLKSGLRYWNNFWWRDRKELTGNLVEKKNVPFPPLMDLLKLAQQNFFQLIYDLKHLEEPRNQIYPYKLSVFGLVFAITRNVPLVVSIQKHIINESLRSWDLFILGFLSHSVENDFQFALSELKLKASDEELLSILTFYGHAGMRKPFEALKSSLLKLNRCGIECKNLGLNMKNIGENRIIEEMLA